MQRMLRLALLACVAGAASAQCAPWAPPPNWPGTIPGPPYAWISARGGGTLDGVTLVKNGTLAATTVGGGGGSALSPAIAACPKGAAIVGFAYSTEINSGYAYQAGAFSGLRSIGASLVRRGSSARIPRNRARRRWRCLPRLLPHLFLAIQAPLVVRMARLTLLSSRATRRRPCHLRRTSCRAICAAGAAAA